MAITFTNYLQTNANGTVQVLASTWVQFTNNNTSNTYISDAASDANGKYTMTGLPSGTYTVAIGPSNSGPWTGTGNTSFQVEPVDATGAGVIPSTLLVGTSGTAALTAGATILGSLTTGTGDNITQNVASTGQLINIYSGTAGSPDVTPNPIIKLNRTVSLLVSQVAGDGVDAASAFQSVVSVPVGGEVQGVAINAYAKTASSSGVADAAAGYFLADAVGTTNRVAMGIFSAARITSTTGKASAVQLDVKNSSGSDHSVNVSGFPSSAGIWITTNGTNLAAAGIDIGNAFGQQFDVGLHAGAGFVGGFTGGIKTSFLQDDATGLYSYLINGTHSSAAIAVKAGAGKVLIGGTSQIQAATLLEVQAPNNSVNPLVLFGSTNNQPYRLLRLQNSAASFDFCIANAGNNFLTGTIAGDTAFVIPTSGKFWHVGGTVSALKVGNDNSVTFTSNPLFNGGLTVAGGQIATIGSGDNVAFHGSNGTAWVEDVRQGTAGSPIILGSGPTLKVSRVEAIPESTMPFGSGADSVGNATIWASSQGLATNEVQATGLFGSASTASTQSAHNDDAGGVVAWGEATGTGYGIGGYLEGRRGATTAHSNGLEVRSNNLSGPDGIYNSAGNSDTMGLWLTASGSPSAVAAAVGAWGAGTTWHVGFAAVAGSVTDQTFRDDSSSSTSLLINGTHATAAAAIAAGAGPLIIGGTTALSGSTTLFEIQAPNSAADPLVTIGSTVNAQPYAVNIRNANGTATLGIATAGGFVSGSVAGDLVILNRSNNKFVHLGGSITLLRAGKDNTLTAYASTATPAGGSSTAHLDFGTTPALGIYFGSGAPSVSTPQGSLYLRTDGTPYYNTNATTGWNPLMRDVGEWTASDHGFISWNFAPEIAGNTLVLTPSGTVFTQRIHIKKAATVSNIHVWMGTIGNTLTLNQCLAGFYDSGGNLLSATGDQSVRWVGTLGLVTMALSAAQSVAAGDYYTAFFYNGTTGPSFNRGANTSLTNVNQSGANLRFATANTLQTTSMPNLLSGYANANAAYWVALS